MQKEKFRILFWILLSIPIQESFAKPSIQQMEIANVPF